MTSPLAVALADRVWRIPTMRWDLINTFVLEDDDGSVTLVDCGLASAPPRVLAGLAQIGKSPSDVTRILLTHAHGDHAGGTVALQSATAAPVEIHEEDAGWAAQGRRPPGDSTLFLGRLFNVVFKNKFAPVDAARTFRDGEVLPVAGGLHVVHTPGHSPGHVSFLHPDSGVLITGDAIFNIHGLRWPVRAFCSDVALTKKTAHRLADLDYTLAAFTHGPHVQERARERVREFLAAAS